MSGPPSLGISTDVLTDIAARVGTPAYVYDAAVLDEGVSRWIDAVGRAEDVFYSVKANSNTTVLARLAEWGIGFEVATVGELARVKRASIPSSRVVFGGVPKTAACVKRAIREGVELLVLQSAQEVEAAIAVAGVSGAVAPVAAGVRVRPGIRAGAHPSLETARADAKFGLPPERVGEAWADLASADGLRPTTLAVHLGSGLEALGPYERALDLLLELTDRLGDTAPVKEIDLGGGLGVDYLAGRDPTPAELVRLVRGRLADRPLRVRYEPGRSMVARAGLLLTRVLYRRERDDAPALVCDAAYTDFARYALYGAEHRIEPLTSGEEGPATVDVLGPTCESGDVLGTGRPLHGVRPGDLIAVRDAGAYGFVMASNYNSRLRPAEVLVEDGEWTVVRERESVEDLWRGEPLPAGRS